MKKIIIIVAGGSGTRMKSATPKQFMLLKGQPLLMHTIRRFADYDSRLEIRLVLPEIEIPGWKELCKKYSFAIEHQLFMGGQHRFHSVKNGLYGIPGGSLVGIHDGVRPLVSQSTIKHCYDLAEREGTAIPVLPLTESIRELIINGSISRERTLYRIVQTPQVFHSEIILDAYKLEYSEAFTDDASVVEANGGKIFLADGNEENIKVTTQKDLKIAEVMLNLA